MRPLTMVLAAMAATVALNGAQAADSPPRRDVSYGAYIINGSNLTQIAGPTKTPAKAQVTGSFTMPPNPPAGQNQTRYPQGHVLNIPTGPIGYTNILTSGGMSTQLVVGGTDAGVVFVNPNAPLGDFAVAINGAGTAAPNVAAMLVAQDGALYRAGTSGVVQATIRIYTDNPNGTDGQDTGMNAVFTPVGGLAAAAETLGFADFNWVQTITIRAGEKDRANTDLTHDAPRTHLDPLPGGYAYLDPDTGTWTTGRIDGAFPYYYDPLDATSLGLDARKTGDAFLQFFDQPHNPCFSGGALVGQAFCNFYPEPDPVLDVWAFTTSLVGVDKFTGLPSDPLFSFTWTSSFNADSSIYGEGGVRKFATADPTLVGQGGVRLLTVNGVAAAVPEPGAWTLMMLGFGLLGWALRRRGRAALQGQRV